MDRKREEEIRLEEEKKVAEERELRFVKEVVVGEVAGWNEWRGREVRRGVRELARGCLEVERGRLQGMLRALRAVRGEPEGFVEEQVFESKVERERGRR